MRSVVLVNAVNKSAASSIAARLTKDSICINADLTSVGLPPATLLEAAVVVIPRMEIRLPQWSRKLPKENLHVLETSLAESLGFWLW